QADLPGGLRLGGVGLADQFGALGGGERDRFGARLRRALGGGDLLGRGGGRAGLDGRRDQGGDPGASSGGGAAWGATGGRPAAQPEPLLRGRGWRGRGRRAGGGAGRAGEGGTRNEVRCGAVAGAGR